MLSGPELASVEAVLDRVGGGLDALWLFGSEAAGRATAESDVDLAALFAVRPSPEALQGARIELEQLLGRPVDLIDLREASPILAMQVLRHGRLVAERRSPRRVRFAAALPGRYEEVVLLRRPGEKLLRARLAHGRT